MPLRDLWGDVDPYKGVTPNDGRIRGFHKCCPILRDVIAETGAKRILEIGAHQGGSAIWMAECSGGEVLTVDAWCLPAWAWHSPNRERWATAFDVFRRTVVARGLQDRVIYLPMLASEARTVLSGERFDMAYVDGDHDYEAAAHDLEMAVELTDGPVVVDDYHQSFPGVMRAVSAYPHEVRGRKAIVRP